MVFKNVGKRLAAKDFRSFRHDPSNLKNDASSVEHFNLRSIEISTLALEPRDIAPYKPIGLGFWLGFEPRGEASMRGGTSASGELCAFIKLSPNGSRWMTLEASLSSEAVGKIGHAVMLLAASAQHRMTVRAVLRLPVKSAPNGFADVAATEITLDARHRTHVVGFDTGQMQLHSHLEFPDPVIVLHFPLRTSTICVSRITVAPMAVRI